LIKALVFDLDDTLYDDETTANETIRATARAFQDRHGIDPEAFRRKLRPTAKEIWYVSPMAEFAKTVGCSSWEGLWMQFYGSDDQAEKMRQWVAAYRVQAWGETLRRLGVDDGLLDGEMAEHFFEERRRRHTVYDDVRPALDSLRSEYRFALLTNGAIDLQQEKIDGSGLGDYLDATVISGEVGIGKPEREPFDLILRRLDISADEAVMIGNSLGSDIAGANGAGMKSIWVNRIGHTNESEARPDAEVRSLDDLSVALQKLA
jgi:putative hydrolase of the HAD superfamily